MRSFRKILEFETRKFEEAINISEECEQALKESRVKEGLALIFPLHTSSAVFISDSDPGIADDWKDLAGQLVPENPNYRHNFADSKKNAVGHLKAILTGHHIVCPVTEGKFDFGTYHTIYYLELDGKRPKRILVKIIGE
jgi:secondary thiamine-phosphate synthase enzyme